jgi:phosphatidate cytidylyltransferase
VADDKRDGDDLFEDLDKFFAPIKDVDWDEPASAGAQEVPSEEHVTVHPAEPQETNVPEQPAEELPAQSVAVSAESSVVGEPEEDDSWYDTSVIDAIEDLDSPDPAHETVPQTLESPLPEPHAAQPDLFLDDDPADAVSSDVGADTAEWELPPREPVMSHAPSEEDLEAAAEHFAGSLRDEDDPSAFEEARVPMAGAELIVDEATGGVERDILSDLDDTSAQRTVTVGGEGLGGPSWQEPASVEVGSDPESRRDPDNAERDVPAAFLTGVVLAILAIGALLIGKAVFAVLATALVLYAQGELYGVMVKHRKQPATAVGLVTGALVMGGAYYHGEPAVLAMFVLGTVATFLWFMAVPATHRQDTLASIGLTLVNVAWIPLLAGYLLLTLQLGDGKQLVVAVIGLTFVFDTAAFLGGSIMGGQFFQRPLAASVSPKKSIEGVIIATLVTVVVSVALVTTFVTPFANLRIDSLLLGVVVAVAATFGDLAESLVKRDMGLKDMGNVLPGHGGVLDRIDSLLFVAPAAFLFFRLIFG